MNIEQMKLSDLVPYIRNAKKHDKAQIDNVAQSIKEFGMVQPIVVDKDNNIIIGHCRALACRQLHKETVPVVKMEDLTPQEANKLRLLDNKLNESAWDFDLLSEDIPDLDFSDYEIDWELPAMAPDIDVVEDELPQDSAHLSLRGDVWILGRHRLMCEDSTHMENVDKLMDGVKADLYITDPPYNVAYEGVSSKKTILNDNMRPEEFQAFLEGAFLAADNVMRKGAVFYIWHSDSHGYYFRGACKNVGWEVRENLIWKKNSMVMGRQDYQWQHEPCLYGWKDGAPHLWASDRKQTTILDFDRPQKSKEHPTMKPVALFAYQISNNTHEGDVVLDSFGGSGTTIMACEQLGRSAYLMELDPSYCDVIIQRYVNFKGGMDDVFCLRNGTKLPYKEVKSNGK